MSISLIVSGLGAVIAATGSGVLLARCFRAPRGDLICWSIALLGLLISLAAQALGHLVGFDAAMFRAMEIGAQVIAPLALILGLSEVAARSAPARFCARLYIPALAIVAIVVLVLDQLADVAFTKAWPDPSVYYQIAPEYVLYALGVITALIAIVTMVTVARRASRPGWDAALRAVLLGGAAALLLAYPAVALLLAAEASVHLPVSSLFAVLCAAAAGLTWLAGTFAGRLHLAQLHGRQRSQPGNGARADRGARSDGARSDGARSGGFDATGAGEPASERGLYRDGGPYRPGPHVTGGYGRDTDDQLTGWRDDQAQPDFDDWHEDGGRAAGADGWRDQDHEPGAAGHWDRNGEHYQSDYATGDFVTGGFATGDLDVGDFGTDRHEPGYPAGDWQPGGTAGDGPDDERGTGGRLDDWQDDRRDDWPEGRRDDWQDDRPDPAGYGAGQTSAERAQLFGQIAIYTLLDDRVDQFDQLAERVVEQVRNREPDALVYIVHAVPSAPMQRILYEVYRDRAAYQRHVRQPHVIEFETDRRPYVLATNVIELGLQQAKVSPFPSVAELFGEPGFDTSGFERPDYQRDFGSTAAPQSGYREFR